MIGQVIENLSQCALFTTQSFQVSLIVIQSLLQFFLFFIFLPFAVSQCLLVSYE